MTLFQLLQGHFTQSKMMMMPLKFTTFQTLWQEEWLKAWRVCG